MGLANGLTIAFLRLPPIIVTLAMLSIVRGSALILGGPEQHLIRGQPAYTFIGAGSLFGLPFPTYIFAGVALAMILLQRRTPFGLLVAAIGDNENAAKLSDTASASPRPSSTSSPASGPRSPGSCNRPRSIRRWRPTGRSARNST